MKRCRIHHSMDFSNLQKDEISQFLNQFLVSFKLRLQKRIGTSRRKSNLLVHFEKKVLVITKEHFFQMTRHLKIFKILYWKTGKQIIGQVSTIRTPSVKDIHQNSEINDKSKTKITVERYFYKLINRDNIQQTKSKSKKVANDVKSILDAITELKN